MQEQKLCSKCQRELPLSDFYIDHRRNKPRGQCKNCDREYKRSTGVTQRHYDRNREQILQRKKERYQANPTHFNQAVQRSYYRHRDKRLADAKAYRERRRREGHVPVSMPAPFRLDAYDHDDILYRNQLHEERLREQVHAIIVDNEFLRVLYEVGDLDEAKRICRLSDDEVEKILCEARDSFR